MYSYLIFDVKITDSLQTFVKSLGSSILSPKVTTTIAAVLIKGKTFILAMIILIDLKMETQSRGSSRTIE